MLSCFNNKCKGFVKVSDCQLKRLKHMELLDVTELAWEKSFREQENVLFCHEKYARFSIVFTFARLNPFYFFSLYFNITSIKWYSFIWAKYDEIGLGDFFGSLACSHPYCSIQVLGTTANCWSPKLWTESRLMSSPCGASDVQDSHCGSAETWKTLSLWEKHREFLHTWGKTDNSSQGLIKDLQTLDFVFSFGVKFSSHGKERLSRSIRKRQRKDRRRASLCRHLCQCISTSQCQNIPGLGLCWEESAYAKLYLFIYF